MRQALISVARLFGFCARVPLEGQEPTSQGKTVSSLWQVLFADFQISLPTSGRECHSECLCTAAPSPRQTSSTETPCSAFISSRESHSATKFIMRSTCGFERRATLITDRVPLLLPRTVLFLVDRVPPCLFRLIRHFFEVLVEIHCLSVVALYHLLHPIQDVVRGAPILFPTSVSTLRVHLHSFCLVSETL